MHIEIGILTSPKLALAAAGASALLAAHAPALLKQPVLWLRTALAAFFFSLLMQAWHLPVGPSELHLVGAMPAYLLFGFVPTLFGFGLGLLLQALLFEPQDMVHLAVNFLSLGLPLVLVHHTLGRRLQRLTVANVVKLDALYYAGVTLMVGFWLSISTVAAPLAGWATFAASYLLLVAVEPLMTIGLVALGGRLRSSGGRALVALAFDEGWCRRAGLAA
ncbi:energy-coupling factor ABC transporter permease [Roseateles saccharophilus]|uniref:ABC-type Co2+ transport system permease subunit n=1 Tax=Roseateles saccharophilus TaxID=304 RepID=A0A4R3UNL0_ROSSA|nr:energy-coupling factor ABC transporter permease [Roseateles saccharophilus]MDG0833509.1 cobalamin biosynthesis protein CbiM [Roseateles saccharophilus]TCU92532.1 ABC-type Co2+ transport system permease subunit [Roseateles saccharophilus]